MVLKFRTEELSDSGLHCLPFRLHLLDSLLYGRATLLKFKIITAIFGCPNIKDFYDSITASEDFNQTKGIQLLYV